MSARKRFLSHRATAPRGSIGAHRVPLSVAAADKREVWKIAADVHRRLERAELLAGLDEATFAEAASQIIGDINEVHPFRKGAGRTQLQYLKPLASRAEHAIDLTRIETISWLEASITSYGADCTGMIRAIRHSIPR